MDVNVLVLLMVFSLILTVLGFMGSRAGWSLLIVLGASIALLTALVLASDASLTQQVGGTTSTVTLAAANGNFVSDFNVLTMAPTAVAIGEMVIAVRRIFRI